MTTPFPPKVVISAMCITFCLRTVPPVNSEPRDHRPRQGREQLLTESRNGANAPRRCLTAVLEGGHGRRDPAHGPRETPPMGQAC